MCKLQKQKQKQNEICLFISIFLFNDKTKPQDIIHWNNMNNETDHMHLNNIPNNHLVWRGLE